MAKPKKESSRILEVARATFGAMVASDTKTKTSKKSTKSENTNMKVVASLLNNNELSDFDKKTGKQKEIESSEKVGRSSEYKLFKKSSDLLKKIGVQESSLPTHFSKDSINSGRPKLYRFKPDVKVGDGTVLKSNKKKRK